jgi:hypothetical protein
MNSNRKIVMHFFATVFLGLLFVAFFLLSYERSQAEKILYTGKEHHVISLEKAKQLTRNFQIVAKPGELAAGYLGRNIFEKILYQEQCVGIRIYNAISENGSPTFVLVGVDTSGNDIIYGPIGDEIYPCPPWCAPGSLNLLTGQPEVALKN